MDSIHAGRLVGIGQVLLKRYLGNKSDNGYVKEIPRASGQAITIE